MRTVRETNLALSPSPRGEQNGRTRFANVSLTQMIQRQMSPRGKGETMQHAKFVETRF